MAPHHVLVKGIHGRHYEIHEAIQRAFPDDYPLVESTPKRSETPDTTWTVAQLRAHAAEHDIALGDARRKGDILAALAPAVDDGTDPAETAPSGDTTTQKD